MLDYERHQKMRELKVMTFLQWVKEGSAMYRVENKRDLATAYNLIRQCEGNNDPKVAERIADLKREIRSYYKRTATHGYRMVKDNCDSYVYLIDAPEWVKSEEDAVEWFEHNEYIPPINSMYDCTGQPFTRWYKVINRNGKWMVYHYVSIDV